MDSASTERVARCGVMFNDSQLPKPTTIAEALARCRHLASRARAGAPSTRRRAVTLTDAFHDERTSYPYGYQSNSDADYEEPIALSN